MWAFAIKVYTKSANKRKKKNFRSKIKYGYQKRRILNPVKKFRKKILVSLLLMFFKLVLLITLKPNAQKTVQKIKKVYCKWARTGSFTQSLLLLIKAMDSGRAAADVYFG